jgi:hypothetical protein
MAAAEKMAAAVKKPRARKILARAPMAKIAAIPRTAVRELTIKHPATVKRLGMRRAAAIISK